MHQWYFVKFLVMSIIHLRILALFSSMGYQFKIVDLLSCVQFLCNPGLEGEGRVSISWFYKGLNLLSLVLSAFKPLIRIQLLIPNEGKNQSLKRKLLKSTVTFPERKSCLKLFSQVESCPKQCPSSPMHESIIAIREILGVLVDLLIIIAVFGCDPLLFYIVSLILSQFEISV